MKNEELFDLIIPPGVPRSIICDIAEKYDVTVVERNEPIVIGIMDGDVRELLAFRGKHEVLEQVQEDLLKQLKEFVGEN